MILFSIAACVLAPAVSLGVLSALARKPEHLGVVDGRLAPCPDSPNCVSSRAEDPVHRIAPLTFDGPTDQALARPQASNRHDSADARSSASKTAIFTPSPRA